MTDDLRQKTEFLFHDWIYNQIPDASILHMMEAIFPVLLDTALEKLPYHYYWAQVRELRGDLADAAHHLDLAGVAPGADWDAYVLVKHMVWAAKFADKQAEDIAAGIPAIHVVSMPKSGSSFLANTLQSLLGVWWCRTSKGGWGRGRVVPSWLATFLKGGATTHEHFPATPENRALLERGGAERVFVHLRHPAAALASLFVYLTEERESHLVHIARESGASVPDGFADWEDGRRREWFVSMFYETGVRFAEGWLDYADAGGIPVVLSTHEAMVEDPAAPFLAMKRDLDLALSEERIRAVVGENAREAREKRSMNFRSGRTDSWKSEFSDTEKAIMAAFDDSPVFGAFGWERVGEG